MNLDVTRSVGLEKTPLKSETEDHDLSVEKGLLSSRDKNENIFESNAKSRRREEFEPDQRGSVNTDVRHARLKNRLLVNRNSLSVRSTLSRGRSEFSFHPSINFTSKWKPKYDDHYDHDKMCKRMHKEMEKIQSKRRLASERKKIEEMAECTFNPKLVTKASKASAEPMNVKQLSLRLYSYADKFKENKVKMRSMIENERGGEIRFTPQLETSRINKQLEVVKERKDVYENLYDDSQRRVNTKNRLKEVLASGTPSEIQDHDLFLTVSKPSYMQRKHRTVYNSLGAKVKSRKSLKVGRQVLEVNAKSFSSSIYSSNRK